MKPVVLVPLLISLLTGAVLASPGPDAPIRVPLVSNAAIDQPLGRFLRLRVQGNARDGFEIEVTSTQPVHGCFPNLVHWAPHGPDPSEVLPWQVASGRFRNPRAIPVCGQPLTVEITLESAALSADGARFTSGTLVVGVRHSKRVARPDIGQVVPPDAGVSAPAESKP